MKFFNFHLMPYAAADLDAIEKNGSAWVTYSNSNYDPIKGAELYHNYLDELEYAEELGFDGVVLNEHHQTAYGMMPTPGVLAGALARSLKKIKIAILGRALPLVSNPLVIAEEYAMLDNLTRGRFIAGFVRGIVAEYHAMGVNPGFSHERFQEAHDLIMQAWTRPGPFEFVGKHYHMRYVNPWPRPYQDPHPPIWIGANADPAIRRAARMGDCWYLNPHQKVETLLRQMDIYKEELDTLGKSFPTELPIRREVFCAPTHDEAVELAAPYIKGMYDAYKTWGQDKVMPEEDRDITQEYEELAKDRFIVGDPDEVAEEYIRYNEVLGVNHIIMSVQGVGMPQGQVLDTLTLVAEEVMPKVRAA